MERVLIDGAWRQSTATGTFKAIDPSTGSELGHEYPVSSMDDAEEALAAAHEVVSELRSTPAGAIADFLDSYADNIESRRKEIIETAHEETRLPLEPRLNSVELPRTTDQIRQAATWKRPLVRSSGRTTTLPPAGFRFRGR